MTSLPAHSMSRSFWIFEPMTPKSPAMETAASSGDFSTAMTLAPCSAAALAAAQPDRPSPMTSTSASRVSATSAGTSGATMKLGTNSPGAVLAAGVGASVPVAAIGSLSAGAAGAQPARPAAPAATAAVAPRPRN